MIGLLLLLGLRQPPLVPPADPFVPPVPEVVQIAGAEVWVLPQPSVPLVRIEVSWGTGYRRQPDPTAAMMAGVLAQRSPALDRESLEAMGGVALIGAGAERAWADVEVLAGHEAEAVAWLAQALQAPRFSSREVRRLRRRWVQARRQAWRSIGRVHNLILSEMLFPDGHPLAFRPTAADWRTVTAGRVSRAWRHMLQDGAVSAVVTGAVTASAIRAPLEAMLATFEGAGRPEPLPSPDWPSRQQVVLVDHPGAQRVLITHTRPAAALEDRHRVLDELASHVLGGSFTSRLSARLRETEGYVYDIESRLLSRPGTGRIEITCSVSLADTAAAMNSISEELAGMASRPPTAAERDASVRALVLEASRQGLRLADLSRPMGLALLHGQPASVAADRLAALQAVSLAALRARAAALFGEPGGVWVLTGDAAELTVALPDAGWDIDIMQTTVR